MTKSMQRRVAGWVTVAVMCLMPLQGIAGNIGTSDIIDGAVTTPKVADGAITAAKIANGAVVDAKISGIIGQDKLGSYANVVTVHKGAANNVSSFNTIRAAINYIGQNTNTYAGERKAILVMPGTYTEDFSLFSDDRQPFNVDIIGSSRTGTIIVPTNRPYYPPYDNNDCLFIPPGMYLKNLIFQGIIYTAHASNAGVQNATVSSPSVGVVGGWQTINNFSLDDVTIETPVGQPAIGLAGTADNDTLHFNNIRIKGGYISITYPISSKPFSFSNISFSGGTAQYPLFVTEQASANTPDPKFIFTNITTDGSYGYGFGLSNTTTSAITVLNSKIDVTTNLYYGSSSSGNTMKVINSDLSVASNNQGGAPAGSLSIGNSRIGTLIPNNNSIKVVNSFDGNFNPIANGQY